MSVGVTWVTQALYVKPQCAILAVKMDSVITHGNVFVLVDTAECFVTFAQIAQYVLNQPIRTQHHHNNFYNLQVAHFTIPNHPKLINTSKIRIQASIFIFLNTILV